MRKYILLISLVLILLIGCAKPAGQVKLGEEFTLAPGQSTTITGENLTVKFVEVVSDSRCPHGATCIWAGEASSLIELTNSQGTFSKVLTQPGLTEPPKTDLLNYEIIFDLTPYPQVGKEIKKTDYRLKMTFNLTDN